MLRILEIAIIVLLAFWVLGFVFRLLGALVHIALVAAVILLVIRLVQGTRRVT